MGIFLLILLGIGIICLAIGKGLEEFGGYSIIFALIGYAFICIRSVVNKRRLDNNPELRNKYDQDPVTGEMLPKYHSPFRNDDDE